MNKFFFLIQALYIVNSLGLSISIHVRGKTLKLGLIISPFVVMLCSLLPAYTETRRKLGKTVR